MQKKIETLINEIFESSDGIDTEFICNKLNEIKEYEGELDSLVMGDENLTEMIKKFINGDSSAQLEIANYIINNLKAQELATYSEVTPVVIAEELGISVASDKVQELIKIPFDEITRDQILNLNNHEFRYVMSKIGNKIADIVLILSCKGFPVRIFSKLDGYIALTLSLRDETNNAHMIWTRIKDEFESKKSMTPSTLQSLLSDLGFNYELTSTLVDSQLKRIDGINIDAVDLARRLFSIDLKNPQVVCYEGFNNTPKGLIEDRDISNDSSKVIVLDNSSAVYFEVPADYTSFRHRLISSLSKFTPEILNSLGVTNGAFKMAQYEIPPYELHKDSPIESKSVEVVKFPTYEYSLGADKVTCRMYPTSEKSIKLRFSNPTGRTELELNTVLPILRIYCFVVLLMNKFNDMDLKSMTYKIATMLSSDSSIA